MRATHLITLVVAMVTAFVSPTSLAQTVFTSNTTINDGDFAYDGQDITIRGCTVTINGDHAFRSIIVEPNASSVAGVLTHAAHFSNGVINGVKLTVSQGVTIATNARIDTSARGQLPADGAGAGVSGVWAGGAGHGGAGRDAGIATAGGDCHGSWSSPSELGSGGGNDTNVGGTTGGAGGGAIVLIVGATLTVDGSLVADGQVYQGAEAGGGAGGSINVRCETLAGAGVISAVGGNAGVGGSGGGGRIALTYGASTFVGTISARGGSNAYGIGGAGTVYLKPFSGLGTIILDNSGTVGEGTEFTGVQVLDANLIARAGGMLSHKHGDGGVQLTFSGDVTVETGGYISASFRGYTATLGPGAGASAVWAGGAGFGGAGRDAGIGTAGGDCYGSVTEPVDLGSGGGNDSNIGGTTGGSGGGALAVIAGGTLRVDGVASADGQDSLGHEAGGGSGGSLRFRCAAFAGSGTLRARGGNAGSGGSGGGGRISVTFGTSTFNGVTDARGGDNAYGRGGAGTVYLKPTVGLGTLLIDNFGSAGEGTEFTGHQSYSVNLISRRGGMVSHKHADGSLELSIDGDVTVESDGLISADFRGYPADTGPGAAVVGVWAGGAGHGGAGRDSGNQTPGGDCYGSVTSPVMFGSGGANDANIAGTTAGAGGGAFTLTAGGTLTVNGVISSNGRDYLANEAGAGSGGSVRLQCGTLAGSGTIAARGGNAGVGGSGGGGRIAVGFDSSAYTGSFDARGGTNAYGRAGAGTVYLKPSAGLGTLIVDNFGTAGEGTEFSGVNSFDANLISRGGGIVTHKHADPGLDLTFAGDVTVDLDGLISVSFRGHPAGSGPGAGTAGTLGGGAGHGGAGRDSGNGVPGGDCYGSITDPVDFGSGGANDTNVGSTTAGAGGGSLSLHVGGDLTVNGVISADGQTFLANEAGAGSGGSVRMWCANFGGSGTVSARGGDGGAGGSGGGGRIAINYDSSDFAGSLNARGGNNSYGRAGAGTIYLKPASELGTMIVDNFGTPGEGTELSGLVPMDGNVLVRGSGLLTHKHGDTAGLTLDVLGDITVEPTGVLGAPARGYAGNTGPGVGALGTQGGGGGYGGQGRAAGSGTPGGATYGLASYPDWLGSGGGNDSNVAGTTAGAGGGKVHLLVGGVLTVDGSIDVTGGTYLANEAGAGSGGSIYALATEIRGSGVITARGGNAGAGGSGGGGRIALYSCTQLLPLANISVLGGSNIYGTASPGSLEQGSSTITIFLQPDSATYSGGDEVSLVVDAIGDGALSYQWRREGVAIVDGGRFHGAQTTQLTISPIDCADGGTYDCIVTDDCGSFPTIPAEISVVAPSDYDHSGFVDTDDYSAFVFDFELGVDAADFDKSGFVDTDDFTAFVLAFEAGC